MPNEPTELPHALLDAATTLATTLDQYRIRYAVIGGLAVGYRSHPRFTRDLDVLLQIPQLTLPGLLEELSRRGFEFDLMPTIREWTQHHMVVLSYQGNRVDWLKPLLPIYAHILDRATAERWLGQTICVASTEGLILLKLLAFRSEDIADIETLIAAAEGDLDVDWIRSEWQTIAALDDPRMKRFEEMLQ